MSRICAAVCAICPATTCGAALAVTSFSVAPASKARISLGALLAAIADASRSLPFGVEAKSVPMVPAAFCGLISINFAHVSQC